MTHSINGSRITLPRWYAAFSPQRAGEVLPEPPDARQALRVGPLTIHHPGSHCKVATFGSGDCPSAVVFEGYLFDRIALARELGCEDSVSKTAELVAAGYQRWGTAIFDRFEGRYLIAVWDASTKRLLVGHDALGRHPVFYASTEGALFFTSNVLALSTSGRVSNRPNRLSLALTLLSYWPEAGQTFFDAIGRVRPGHYLEATSPTAVSERKYWEPFPQDDEPWIPDGEALEAFEPALTQAVARCLEQGAQGIMLSGGVDSVTVAALASELLRERSASPLVAVSARTGLSVASDEHMQSRVAAALGMSHNISTTLEWRQGRTDVSLSLEVIPELPSPTPVWWTGTYMRFYRRTAAQGLGVLLTGAGGDNWLGVADTYAADLIRGLHFVELAGLIKADARTGGGSVLGSVRQRVWTGGLRPLLDSRWARVAPSRKLQYHRWQWLRRLPEWLCPEQPMREELVECLLSRRTPSLTGSGSIPKGYYRHSLSTVSNPYLYHEMENAYHIETACGLRLLSPYHDRRLVSFFTRISPRLLSHGNRYKGLLRPVVARHLRGLGLEDQRKEYPAESSRRWLEELRNSVAEEWPQHRFQNLGRLGVVDPAGARGQGNEYPRKGIVELGRMATLMGTERWVELHTKV